MFSEIFKFLLKMYIKMLFSKVLSERCYFTIYIIIVWRKLTIANYVGLWLEKWRENCINIWKIYKNYCIV